MHVCMYVCMYGCIYVLAYEVRNHLWKIDARASSQINTVCVHVYHIYVYDSILSYTDILDITYC